MDYVNVTDDETGASVPAMFSRETGEAFTGCCTKGISPLHKAALSGDTELVEELVRSGADVNMLFKTVPPLYIATKFKHIDTIKMLIKLKCDVNAKTIELEQTALHCAVSLGSLEICTVLCDYGANINQRDHDGATPVWLAASNGQLDVLQFLIQRGADIDIPVERGLTPLAAAVQNGIVSTVRCLLQSKARLDMDDNQGNNALFHAVKGGQVEVCRLLINAGACVNRTNNAKEYPIGIAAMYGNSTITDILIRGGGNVNVVSRQGTPVYASVERQHLNVLKRLITAGADVGYIAPKKRLPLTEALHQHTPSYDIILELLRAGSDIDSAICECHDSPVNMVISKCNIPIVILLVQADTKLGAIPESKMEEMKMYCPFTYNFLQEHARCGVPGLKALCRKAIKRSVGTVHYRNKLQLLPVPPPLKKYLYHQDVYLPDPKNFSCSDDLFLQRPTAVANLKISRPIAAVVMKTAYKKK